MTSCTKSVRITGNSYSIVRHARFLSSTVGQLGSSFCRCDEAPSPEYVLFTYFRPQTGHYLEALSLRAVLEAYFRFKCILERSLVLTSMLANKFSVLLHKGLLGVLRARSPSTYPWLRTSKHCSGYLRPDGRVCLFVCVRSYLSVCLPACVSFCLSGCLSLSGLS